MEASSPRLGGAGRSCDSTRPTGQMLMNPYEPPKSVRVEPQVDFDDRDEIKRIDTLEYVLSSLQMLQSITTARGTHVSGIDVCRMVLQLAFDLNGSQPAQALEFLRNMQLPRSEDVGNAIYELIDLGYIRNSPDDSRSEFDGVYDVVIPTTAWKCCWSITD